MTPSGTNTQARVIGRVVLSMTVTALPVFLVGAHGGLLRADLGFSVAELGIVIAMFHVWSAPAAPLAGRIVQRRGPDFGLAVGAMLSFTAVLVAVSSTASWEQLAVAVGISGLGNAFAQPGTNLALADRVDAAWHGRAFGIKQASIPAATLVAGVVVPTVSVTFGWRAAFAGVGLLAIPLVTRISRRPRQVAVIRHPPGTPRSEAAAFDVGDDSPPAIQRPIVLLVAGGAFGTAMGNSLAAFLVESGTAAGLTLREASGSLVVGSVAGIVSRVYWGWRVDARQHSALLVVVGMLVVGAGGLAVLAVATSLPAVLLGAVVAFAGGWSWNGLMHLSLVRLRPGAAAEATGLLTLGLAIGGIVGPPAFGYIAVHASFQAAWLTTAVGALLSAALILVARHRCRQPAKIR